MNELIMENYSFGFMKMRPFNYCYRAEIIDLINFLNWEIENMKNMTISENWEHEKHDNIRKLRELLRRKK